VGWQGVVNHSIRAGEGLLPGLRGEKAAFEEQGDRLRNELVEVLDGKFDEFVFIHLYGDCIAILRVAAQSRQPGAESTCGGEDAILEAKQTGIVGPAGLFRKAVHPALVGAREPGSARRGVSSAG